MKQKKTSLPADTLTKHPVIHPSVFVAKGAVVVGDVHVCQNASIWYNAVVRGDINQIVIGEGSNIQDGVVIHLENDRGCTIGPYVTVGHRAILHGCQLEEGCLIGMGAILLNGSVVGTGSVVAAGSVVKEMMQIPAYTLVAGVPAKIIKSLPKDTLDTHFEWAQKYIDLAQLHQTYCF